MLVLETMFGQCLKYHFGSDRCNRGENQTTSAATNRSEIAWLPLKAVLDMVEMLLLERKRNSRRGNAANSPSAIVEIPLLRKKLGNYES